MLRDYAHTFATLCKGLEAYRNQLPKGAKQYIRKGDPQFQNGIKTLELTKTLCGILPGLEQITPEIERISAEFEQDKIPIARLSQHFEHLNNRIFDELRHHLFLHVMPSVTTLYGKFDLFGLDVARKFPELQEDIRDAGNCLALGQSTATVFHLMRVMERSVQAFAKMLGVKVKVESETWYEILENVGKRIDKLAKKTDAQRKKKAKFSAVSALLHNVRIAWRNEVMHPKASYNIDEAQDIFSAVQTFVRHLAAIK